MVFIPMMAFSERPTPDLARLGSYPDWSQLDKFQKTMTRAEFVYLLDHCYAKNKSDYSKLIEIHDDRAVIMKQSNYSAAGNYEMFFKMQPDAIGKAETYWRDTYQMDDLPANSSKPLQGIKIVVDPGHIGGDWVQWDDRHFKIGSTTMEVREGEMTLIVAKILERDLTNLGAIVNLTRYSNNPVTEARPEALTDQARAYLYRKRKLPSRSAISATSKYMFAISSEIQTRARLINENYQPDLAICLHFNASPWGRKPYFRTYNHLHLLINGCYSNWEIKEDDSRFQMVNRIMQRLYYPELGMAKEIAQGLVKETGLPPFKYGKGSSGKAVCESDYIYARNLLANRSFMCPVVFCEPFCMNHREVYERVQEGEYSGLREFNGRYRKNIYQEYADGVTTGLVRYFRKRR